MSSVFGLFVCLFACMATIDDNDDNESESFFHFGEKKMIRQKIYRNDILSL